MARTDSRTDSLTWLSACPVFNCYILSWSRPSFHLHAFGREYGFVCEDHVSVLGLDFLDEVVKCQHLFFELFLALCPALRHLPDNNDFLLATSLSHDQAQGLAIDPSFWKFPMEHDAPGK